MILQTLSDTILVVILDFDNVHTLQSDQSKDLVLASIILGVITLVLLGMYIINLLWILLQT